MAESSETSDITKTLSPPNTKVTSTGQSESMSHPNDSTEPPKFQSYLLLHNIGKKQNFGQLLRSALAFGVSEVGIVGAKKISEVSLFGNQGTSCHANFRFFDKLRDARAYYASKDIDICGIEIGENSKVIYDNSDKQGPGNSNSKFVCDKKGTPWPFKRSTCFMLGNEGTGMTDKQIQSCDFLTYIPQHSTATASLNVLVAGSIVLHHFSLFANMEGSKIEGQKFVTEKPRDRLAKFENPTELEKEAIERKREERARKKQKIEGGESNGLNSNLNGNVTVASNSNNVDVESAMSILNEKMDDIESNDNDNTVNDTITQEQDDAVVDNQS